MNTHSENTNVEEKEKGKATFWQFIKFGMVGVVNTVVSYVTYSICYYVFHANAYIASIWGFVISVLNAYLLQSRFVFKESEEGEHRVWWKVLIKTYVSYSFTGLFLAEVLLVFWLNVLKIDQLLGPAAEWMVSMGVSMTAKDLAVSLAPFLNMAITIPINFCINKFWAYRQKSKKETTDNKLN